MPLEEVSKKNTISLRLKYVEIIRQRRQETEIAPVRLEVRMQKASKPLRKAWVFVKDFGNYETREVLLLRI